MINSKYSKIRFKGIILLVLFVFLTGFYGISLMINSNSIINEDDPNNEINLKNDIKTSPYGEHSVWWDKNYHSRQVINITNPNSEMLYNYGVSISFDYTQLVLDGLMKSNLEDIRIIEYKGADPETSIPYERKYYFQKDYPVDDIVTVWFETNVTANNGDSELDTYLYYGNDDANINTPLFMNETTSNSIADNFGWVRNGNFEQDPGIIGEHAIDGVFGWYYADDIPYDLRNLDYQPDTPDPINYQHNLSITAEDQELRNEGTYTFKFGDIAHTVVNDAGIGKDLSGTLFSAPFVVPTVSGGSNKIYINAWRNFRTYDEQNAKRIGVYVRVATSLSYSSTDVDSHRPHFYVERFDSLLSDASKKNYVLDFYSTTEKNTAAGDLTGDLTIDVSDYQGQAIFLEFGMLDYNDEALGKFNAFAQVDNVTFTYDLEVTLDSDAERRKAEVTIIVKDVDGRIVPNAEVSLIMNSSQPIADQFLYGPINSSENNGAVFITSVTYGNYYNISVNYTIASTGFETVVYNSSVIGGRNFNVTESQHTFTIYVDIWTIDFEMVDYDKEPLNYGYVAVYNDTENGDNLENLTLNAADGKSTFRWRNQSSYYFKVFYENYDYNLHTTALNESYIYRSDYDQAGEKFQTHSIMVNASNTALGPAFTINKTIYTNGSLTELGNKKILEADINVTIPNYHVDNQKLTSISIYYIDKNNYYEENEDYLIYYNDNGAELDDFFSFDIDMRSPLLIPNTLEENKYEVYGLRIVATGINTTRCDGTIDFSFNETTNIYNVTEMCKLNIRVVDDGGDDFPGSVTVIVNSSIKSQNFYVNLTTYQAPLLNGYAYGEINQIPLWYLRGYEYNISLNWNDVDRKLNVTYAYPDQWRGPDNRDYYNYTLTQQSNITLFCDTSGTDPAESRLKLDDLEVVDAVTWGENISIQVNFTKTDDAWASYTQVTTDATVTCHIESTGSESSIVLEKSMISVLNNGIFNVTFNSSRLSAGGLGKYYYIIISGERDGWGIGYASNISDSIFIKTVRTNLSMHDYYNFPNIIDTDSQTYGESLNLTFSYSNTTRLKGATLTYEWLAFGAIQFYEDPVNDGYYTTTIDTSLAGVWGTKTFKIIATLENYTTQILFTTISITERPTVLNGSDMVIFLSESVFALETEYFEFNYTDVISSTRISNPEDASYSWQKLDEDGDPIPGENKIGTLNETIDHRYILDLDTESMEVGDYFVFITLNKINYELRNVVIDLTIDNRITSVNGSTGTFTIDVTQTLNFTYSYIDDLTNTSITNLGTQSWTYNGTADDSGTLEYDSTNEIYYLKGFNTASLLDGTYTITVTFEKQNYTTQVVTSTLVITYIRENYESFLTLISQSPSNFSTGIVWRDNVTVTFNFTTQLASNPQELSTPTTLTLQFLDESLNVLGSSINLINYDVSVGYYSYTFNTSQFLLIGGESYHIQISATKTTPTVYTPPTPLQKFFKVQSVATNLTIHDFNTDTELPSYTLTEYWNQTFGITFYFGELISSAPITNAVVTYSWALGSGQINPDVGKGPGYYSFFFDTGNATEVGTYIISILAVKQNFSNGVPSTNLIITIINRPTQLNLNEDVLYLRQTFDVLDSINYTFEFFDFLTMKILKNADEKSFILHRREANGDPIPGSAITGSLHETADHQYILDLDTETLQEGEYSVVVTLDKDNYDIRVAIMSLTIFKREFTLLFLPDTIINLDSGEEIEFIITLSDLNNNSAPIIGADLTFTIRGIDYSTITGEIIDNNDGTYTVNTDTISKPFIQGETFIGTLMIAKANYTSETREFTVVIKMEEIFSGIPTFYFIIISASVIGVLGSLTAYRIIQQARIPKHVKKIRKIKKLIKSKKVITEVISVPTKAEMIVKLFGSDWKEIGVSLDETLGIKDLKTKKLSLKDKIPEEKLKKDKLEQKKLEKEKHKKDKLEQKKLEKEKLKMEKLEKEKLEKEKLEKEKLEKKKLEDNELPKERGENE